ncbi:MAG: response regulator [Candidatus Omnitrophica bacterium]|nr:response regulator [Candidatus Omnitrophota bacterium]
MEKLKILVVDDEEEIRQSLKNLLERRIKCEVRTAEDGNKALELIQKEDFSLILLDIKMPGLSGTDVLKKVKVISPYISVIMITGYDSPQVVQEVFKEGAQDYILKPLNVEVVYQKVKEVFDKRGEFSKS